MARRYTAVAAIVALFTLSIGSLLAAPSLKRAAPWHRQITAQHTPHRVALVTPAQVSAASIRPGFGLNQTAATSPVGAAAGATAAGSLAEESSAPQPRGWVAEKLTQFQDWSGDRISDVAEMVSATWHSGKSKKKHSTKPSKVDSTPLVHRTVGGIPDPPPPPVKKSHSKKKGSGAVSGASQGGTGGTPPGDPPGQGGSVTSPVAGTPSGSSGSGSGSGGGTGTPLASGTSGGSGGSSGTGSGSGSGTGTPPASGTSSGSGGSGSGSGTSTGTTPTSGTSSGSGGSTGSGSGSGGSSSPIQPFQKVKIADMPNSQTPSYTFSDQFIAQNGMMVTIYNGDAAGQVDLLKRAKGIHALNPDFKFLLYTLMQAYRGGNSTIDSHESWFLHNPDGSTNPGDRVWRWENGAQTYIMDIRNSGYQDYMMGAFVDIVVGYGLDGIYADGPHYNFDLPQDMGWEHSPTTDQSNNWWNWETTQWYPKLKAKFDAAASGKWIITNTSGWGSPSTGGAWDDSAVLPYVTGTYIEFWCGFTLSGGTGYDWWWTRTNVIQRNTSKGKVTVLNPTNFAPSQDALYLTYLLDADGTYVYFENSSWSQGALVNEQPRSVGIPTGPAINNPDGTWTRPFAPDGGGHFVEFTVNPSENGHGGLPPWGFTATWH